MASRQYGQYCAIAKALDVLGDRWALLIVRQLLFGALRYSDLQAALPGIATDMLATRLRELETAGVVARTPGGAKGYELTARGHDLRPVLEALAVWGLSELTQPSRDEAFDARWMALPFSGMVRAERTAGVTLTVKLVVDDGEVALRVEDDRVDFAPVDGSADVTVAGPPEAFAAAVTAPSSPAAQRLDVRGERRDVERLFYVLGLTDTPPRAGRERRRSPG